MKSVFEYVPACVFVCRECGLAGSVMLSSVLNFYGYRFLCVEIKKFSKNNDTRRKWHNLINPSSVRWTEAHGDYYWGHSRLDQMIWRWTKLCVIVGATVDCFVWVLAWRGVLLGPVVDLVKKCHLKLWPHLALFERLYEASLQPFPGQISFNGYSWTWMNL